MAMLEALESRQLLSSVFLGNQCLPPAPAAPPVVNQPDAIQTALCSPKPVAGKPRVGPGPTPNPTPRPTPAPITGLIGDWGGAHFTSDEQVQGGMQLRISRSPAGELHGLLTFSGPESFEHKARLQFNAKTGRFTLTVFSVKKVIRIDGVLTSDGDGGTKLVGGVRYYTKQGAYKAEFDLRRAG